MLLPLTGGVPGFTSIPLPNSFISMSIYNTSQKATESHVKTSVYLKCQIQMVQYLAGGRLHHAVVGAHDASVRLRDWGLSVDIGGLGLGRSGR